PYTTLFRSEICRSPLQSRRPQVLLLAGESRCDDNFHLWHGLLRAARRSTLKKIAFLNSWHRSAERGSGTAVAIQRLEEGIRRSGHAVETVLPIGSLKTTTLGRLLYNLALPVHLRGRSFDLVIG